MYKISNAIKNNIIWTCGPSNITSADFCGGESKLKKIPLPLNFPLTMNVLGIFCSPNSIILKFYSAKVYRDGYKYITQHVGTSYASDINNVLNLVEP